MKEVLKGDFNFKKIAGMVQTRIETFPDIPALIDFFQEVPEYDASMYCHKKMKTNEETSLTVLKEVLPFLEAQEDYTNAVSYTHLPRLLRHLQAEQIRSLTVRRLLQMESIPFRARIMPTQQHFSVAQVH